MRDDLSAPNLGQAKREAYDAPFFWQSYRTIEQWMARLLSKGPLNVSTLTADEVVAPKVTGNLTGNVTGNVTGDILTGRALFLNAPSTDFIELGRVDGVASTPFIDFHSGATVVDYDARLIASGGTGVSGGGLLTVYGAQLALAKGQLKFPAVETLSADPNTLDAYEEGDFTPVWAAATGAFGAITYGRQFGKYTKTGRVVVITGSINCSAVAVGTASGHLYIGGLPFVVANDIAMHSGDVSYATGFTTVYPTAMLLGVNTSQCRLYSGGAASPGGVVSVSNLNASNDIYFHAAYMAAT